jgi:uncharacterized protein YacL
MNKSDILRDILWGIIILAFSLILAYFVPVNIAISFLLMLPTIIGILFAGVLASLAIIFGLMSSNELALIYKRSKEVINKDSYGDFLRNTRIDAKSLFSLNQLRYDLSKKMKPRRVWKMR